MSSGGTVVDSVNASCYLLINKVSDTAWVMQQFDLKDRLVASGTYKDADLSTAHGVFNYYNEGIPLAQGVRIPTNSMRVVDLTNYVPAMYLKTKGQYVNGRKNGIWTDYFQDGSIEFVNTLKDDVLNGPFYNYDHDSKTIAIKGVNENGVAVGDMEFLDTYGNIWKVAKYKQGKLISTKTVKIIDPVAPANLYEHIKNRLKNNFDSSTDINLYIKGTVDSVGSFDNLTIFSKLKVPQGVIDSLRKSLAVSPKWKPAYYADNHKAINYSIIFSMSVANGEISLKHSPSLDYDLTANFNKINVSPNGYVLMEVAPKFPGGLTELNKKLLKGLERVMSRSDMGSGRAIISFTVFKDGSVGEVKCNGSGLADKVALVEQVMKAMPKWEPGYQNGEPVNIAYTTPIFLNVN